MIIWSTNNSLSLKNFKLLKTFNPEFSNIEVWYTDQNSTLLEIEDKLSMTLIINQKI